MVKGNKGEWSRRLENYRPMGTVSVSRSGSTFDGPAGTAPQTRRSQLWTNSR